MGYYFGIEREIEVDAMKIGIEASIVCHFLKHWCVMSKAKKKVIDGLLYASVTLEDIKDSIPYISNEEIIECLKCLYNSNFIDCLSLETSNGRMFFYTIFLKTELIKNNDSDFPTNSKQERIRNKGFVYILKCADKYKIGYSINVEKRISQLDTRPFPLELIYKIESDVAFDIEQRMHNTYTELGYRLDGEWYSSDLPVKDVIRAIDYAVADNIGTDEAWEEFEKKYKEQEN